MHAVVHGDFVGGFAEEVGGMHGGVGRGLRGGALGGGVGEFGRFLRFLLLLALAFIADEGGEALGHTAAGGVNPHAALVALHHLLAIVEAHPARAVYCP